MTCRDLERLVTAFVDGELDDRRASAMRGHARTCAACAQRIEDEASVRDAVQGLEPDEPPAALWSGIEARLAEAEIADARRSRLWLWWQGVRRKVALGGALAAAVAAVLAVWIGSQPSVERAQVTPAPAEQRPVLTFEQQRAAEIAAADRRYRDAIDELRALFEEERAGWPDDRAREFEARLAELDRQVATLREAAHEASDAAARDELFATYRAELALLQDAALMGGEPW